MVLLEVIRGTSDEDRWNGESGSDEGDNGKYEKSPQKPWWDIFEQSGKESIHYFLAGAGIN